MEEGRKGSGRKKKRGSHADDSLGLAEDGIFAGCPCNNFFSFFLSFLSREEEAPPMMSQQTTYPGKTSGTAEVILRTLIRVSLFRSAEEHPGPIQSVSSIQYLNHVRAPARCYKCLISLVADDLPRKREINQPCRVLPPPHPAG